MLNILYVKVKGSVTQAWKPVKGTQEGLFTFHLTEEVIHVHGSAHNPEKS